MRSAVVICVTGVVIGLGVTGVVRVAVIAVAVCRIIGITVSVPVTVAVGIVVVRSRRVIGIVRAVVSAWIPVVPKKWESEGTEENEVVVIVMMVVPPVPAMIEAGAEPVSA